MTEHKTRTINEAIQAQANAAIEQWERKKAQQRKDGQRFEGTITDAGEEKP